MQAIRSLLFLAALAMPCAAFATPITYFLTGTGTGTLGTTSFTGATVTFTEIADTNDVTNVGYFFNNGGPVTLNISGVGSSVLDSDSNFFSQPGPSNGSFGVGANNGVAYFSSPAIATYDLTTALPLTAAQDAGWGGSFSGSAGDLTLTSLSTDLAGSATLGVALTPEPSSLALLGTGLMGALAVARRRFGTRRA